MRRRAIPAHPRTHSRGLPPSRLKEAPRAVWSPSSHPLALTFAGQRHTKQSAVVAAVACASVHASPVLLLQHPARRWCLSSTKKERKQRPRPTGRLGREAASPRSRHAVSSARRWAATPPPPSGRPPPVRDGNRHRRRRRPPPPCVGAPMPTAAPPARRCRPPPGQWCACHAAVAAGRRPRACDARRRPDDLPAEVARGSR